MIDAIEQLKNGLKGDNMNQELYDELIARKRIYKITKNQYGFEKTILISDEEKTFKNINNDESRNNIEKAHFIINNLEKLASTTEDATLDTDLEQVYTNIKSVEAIGIYEDRMFSTSKKFKDTSFRDGWEICGIDLTTVIMYEFIFDDNTILRLDFQGMINNEKDEQIIYFNQIAEYSSPIKSMEKTKELLNEIMQEGDHIIELSGYPINEEPNNMFSEDTGLQPKGDFAYMVEFFSFDLVDEDDNQYKGAYGLNDEYIEDAMILTNKVKNRAEALRAKYEDKGVQVTVNGFNDGCQGGLAIYLWIPYQ